MMKGALAQEEAGRKEDKEALRKVVNELAADKAELQVKRPHYDHLWLGKRPCECLKTYPVSVV